MMDLAMVGIVRGDRSMPRAVMLPSVLIRDGWSGGPGGSSALLPWRIDADLSYCQVTLIGNLRL